MNDISMRKIRPILLSSMFIVLLSASGCSWWDDLMNNINWAEREYSNTEDTLNRAIADINANSQNWQRIMQKAIDDINPKERQVRQDLEELMQRGVHTAGIEARCDICYLGDMLVQGLQRIEAKIKNQPVPPLKPFICDVSPSAIDMNLDPNRRNNVEIYGYNLDMSWLKLYHIMETGQVDETPQFTVTSPFKRVINLGANGIALVPNSVKIRMDLGNGENRDIPIIQQWPDICVTRDFNTGASSIQVIPSRTGPGDKEFDGHGPCIRATAQIYTAENGTQLRAVVNVDMWECPDDMTKIHKDYTEGIGMEDRVLYTTEHDEEIVEIRTPVSATLEYIGHGTQPQSKTDSGLVSRWNMLADTDGDDVGKSYVTVTFNPVHLVLRKKLNCVTELELTRMMQQNAMSDNMINHLRTVRPIVFQRFETLKPYLRRRIQ
jgi:hypothetical protein